MAVLSDEQRNQVLADWMRFELGSLNVTKADLKAAIVALDQFLEDNRAVINNAIPQPARSSLTTRQKIFILRFVLDRRLAVGSDN